MAELITQKSKINSILRKTYTSLIADFNEKYDAYGGRCLADFKKDRSLARYSVNFYYDSGWSGIGLDGPSLSNPDDDDNLLQFAIHNTASGAGLVAGALIEDGDRTWLCHDGRVYTRDGRGRPSGNKGDIAIGEKNYHIVTDLTTSTFFEDIINFHLSRLNEEILAAPPTAEYHGKTGFDPGTAKGGFRSEATFSAQQHPVCVALKYSLEKIGFSVAETKIVSPDLLMKRRDESILFEVKPGSKSHDIMLACAQLLIYNTITESSKMVLVCGEAKDTEMSRVIHDFVSGVGILFLRYKIIDGVVHFPSLQKTFG